MLLLLEGTIGFVVALLAVLGGVGVLYLIRDVRALAVGPSIRAALPLQQLAGGDAQPLLRMAVAWVPAGLVAGCALRALAHLRVAARTAVVAVLCTVLLLAAGAVSDAVAISDPIAPHVAAQLSRTGTWVAVALMVTGSLLARPGRRAARPPASGLAPSAG